MTKEFSMKSTDSPVVDTKSALYFNIGAVLFFFLELLKPSGAKHMGITASTFDVLSEVNYITTVILSNT